MKRKRFVYTPLIMALLSFANAQEQDPVDSIPPAPQPEEPAGSKAEDIGFTWWNDVPEYLQRGNRAYFDGDFETAEDYYQNADLKDQDRGEVPLNLGLSRAQQGNMRGAIYSFEDAQRLAGEDKILASDAAYNRGVAHLERADQLQELMENDPEAEDMTEDLLRDLFSAVDAFDEAIELRDGQPFEDAELNKRLAQHRIQMNSQMQEQQQQQQSEDGEEGDEGEQGESGEPNDESSDSQGQESGDQGQQGEQGQSQDQSESGDQEEDQEQQPNEGQDEQEQQEQQEQDQEQGQGDPSDSEGGQGGQAQADVGDQLTEEQARELLNLIKDAENIKLRKARSRTKPLPEKDW